MVSAICASINSRRSFVALAWTIISTTSALGFLVILGITLSNKRYNNYYDDDGNNEGDGDGEEEQDFEVSIASQAMLFAFIWTCISSLFLSVFGTVLLGVIGPSGTLYSCCPPKVARVSPVAIGTFIGALLMYANLSLVCAVLFGRFNIRDYSYRDDREEDRDGKELAYLSNYALQKSSTAFSFLCLFLSLMYAGFGGMLYSYQSEIMNEIMEEEKAEMLAPSPEKRLTLHPTSSNNYYAGSPLDSRNKYITNKSDIPERIV